MTSPSSGTLDATTRSRIFFSLYGAVLSSMIGVGIVIPLLPRYAATLGASGIWIGAIFSAFALSRVLFLPVFGKISDSHGRRRLILIGLSAYTLLSILYLLANSVLAITALRFLHGIASAMVLPVAIAYINDIAPVGGEGKFIGSFVSSIYLGMSLGPLIGGIIVDLFSMNAVFPAMALFSLVALLTSLKYLPDIPAGPVVTSSFRTCIFHASLRGPILYQLMYALANGSFMVFLPLMAIRSTVIPASQVGMIILVSVLSTPVFQHFFSRFADQFERYHLMAAGVAMMGLSLLLVPEFHGFGPYLVSALIMGIGRGLSLPAMFALVTVAGREIGQGSASGMVNMSLAIGLIIAPLLSGVVMDLSGISVVFYLSGLISMVCTLIFLRMLRSGSAVT